MTAMDVCKGRGLGTSVIWEGSIYASFLLYVVACCSVLLQFLVLLGEKTLYVFFVACCILLQFVALLGVGDLYCVFVACCVLQ